MSDLDKKVLYILCDDGGANLRHWPLLLPIGSTFKHEYGTYKVEQYMEPGKGEMPTDGEFTVICERISKDSL